MRSTSRSRAAALAAGFAIVIAAAAGTARADAPNASDTRAATAAAAPYCGITWGSLPEVSTSLTAGAVAGVRSGRHTCFDRLVVDVRAGTGALGYSVRYVTAVTNPGSGLPVAVAGGARLQVTVNAPATRMVPAGGTQTYPGWNTFRQLRWVASFEGYTDFGLGVRARLPMRTFVLTAPDGTRRLVVDVAHAW